MPSEATRECTWDHWGNPCTVQLADVPKPVKSAQQECSNVTYAYEQDISGG